MTQIEETPCPLVFVMLLKNLCHLLPSMPQSQITCCFTILQTLRACYVMPLIQLDLISGPFLRYYSRFITQSSLVYFKYCIPQCGTLISLSNLWLFLLNICEFHYDLSFTEIMDNAILCSGTNGTLHPFSPYCSLPMWSPVSKIIRSVRLQIGKGWCYRVWHYYLGLNSAMNK